MEYTFINELTQKVAAHQQLLSKGLEPLEGQNIINAFSELRSLQAASGTYPDLSNPGLIQIYECLEKNKFIIRRSDTEFLVNTQKIHSLEFDQLISQFSGPELETPLSVQEQLNLKLRFRGEKFNVSIGTFEKINVSSNEFLKRINMKDVNESILEGRCVPQFVFAGKATRLGMGALFGLSIQDIIDTYCQSHPVARDLELKIKDQSCLRYDLTLGQRICLQYRYCLERLATSCGYSVSECLMNQLIIIHVGEEDFKGFSRVFKEADFFGFHPENVIFVVQKNYPAFTYRNNTLCALEDLPRYPYGHGQTLSQLLLPNTGIRFGESGFETYKESIYSILRKKNARMFMARRINDLTCMDNACLDTSRIGFGLEKMRQGHHVIVELVSNPEGQKGGAWLKWKDGKRHHEFLLETINAGTPTLRSALSDLQDDYFVRHGSGAPYNKFSQMYSLESLDFLNRSGLHQNLRLRNEGYTLESTSGDITWIDGVNAAGFMVVENGKDSVIHDFKDIGNIGEAIRIALQQESQPGFESLVKQYIHKRNHHDESDE